MAADHNMMNARCRRDAIKMRRYALRRAVDATYIRYATAMFTPAPLRHADATR